MSAQVSPWASQRCHWCANSKGAVPSQVPLAAVKVWPSSPVPTIAGGEVASGGLDVTDGVSSRSSNARLGLVGARHEDAEAQPQVVGGNAIGLLTGAGNRHTPRQVSAQLARCEGPAVDGELVDPAPDHQVDRGVAQRASQHLRTDLDSVSVEAQNRSVPGGGDVLPFTARPDSGKDVGGLVAAGGKRVVPVLVQVQPDPADRAPRVREAVAGLEPARDQRSTGLSLAGLDPGLEREGRCKSAADGTGDVDVSMQVAPRPVADRCVGKHRRRAQVAAAALPLEGVVRNAGSMSRPPASR